MFSHSLGMEQARQAKGTELARAVSGSRAKLLRHEFLLVPQPGAGRVAVWLPVRWQDEGWLGSWGCQGNVSRMWFILICYFVIFPELVIPLIFHYSCFVWFFSNFCLPTILFSCSSCNIRIITTAINLGNCKKVRCVILVILWFWWFRAVFFFCLIFRRFEHSSVAMF